MSIKFVLIGWNVLDALVHVLVNQVETLRIAGNVVIILVALLTHFKKEWNKGWVILGGLAIHVALNGVFVANFGVGGPAFFIFTGITAILLILDAKKAARGV